MNCFAGPAFFNASVASTGPAGLLDGYTFDELVVSMRLRSSSYAGPLLRVEDGTTLVQTDIYPDTSGRIDTALASALGAHNGNLAKWYYQDGSGNYFAPSSKPNIYTGGAMRATGVQFDGTNHWLTSNANCSASGCFSVFITGTRSNVGDGSIHMMIENNNPTNGTTLYWSETNNQSQLYVSDGSNYVQSRTTSDIGAAGSAALSVLGAVANRAQATAANKSKLFFNGSAVAPASGSPDTAGTVSTASVNTAGIWQVGSRAAGSSYRWKGAIHTIAISRSDQSTNASAISSLMAVA